MINMDFNYLCNSECTKGCNSSNSVFSELFEQLLSSTIVENLGLLLHDNIKLINKISSPFIYLYFCFLLFDVFFLVLFSF